MDVNKYFKLVFQGDIEKAINYKNKKLPNTLYKYYSITDNDELNNSKINCLKNKSVYLSSLEEFNDPFEGMFFKTNENDVDFKMIKVFQNSFKKLFKYTSFTNTNQNNMPMWAYYSNNHNGFCVEYSSINEEIKNCIFPIFYTNERKDGNIIYKNILNLCSRVSKGKSVSSIDYDKNMQLLFMSMFVKHKSWQHEKEYRLFGFDQHFNIEPCKIYIGNKCNKTYEDKIIKTAKFLNIDIYKMKFNDTSSDYIFDSIRIN